MTAGAADSKILNQPVTFKSNRIIRFKFESNLEASQVPSYFCLFLCRLKETMNHVQIKWKTVTFAVFVIVLIIIIISYYYPWGT